LKVKPYFLFVNHLNLGEFQRLEALSALPRLYKFTIYLVLGRLKIRIFEFLDALRRRCQTKQKLCYSEFHLHQHQQILLFKICCRCALHCNSFFLLQHRSECVNDSKTRCDSRVACPYLMQPLWEHETFDLKALASSYFSVASSESSCSKQQKSPQSSHRSSFNHANHYSWVLAIGRYRHISYLYTVCKRRGSDA